MATIVTRETAGTGATVKGSPLTNAEIDQNFINLNTELANASALTSGTVSGDRGVSAGSSTSSFIEYNGLTKTSGQFDGGAIAPTNTVRLNYDGYLYATRFYGDGSQLSNLSTSSFGSFAANNVLASPNGASGTPSFRPLVQEDITSSALGTGTANSTTFLRGDRTWEVVSLPSGQTAGSSTSGYLQYSGTTSIAGQINGSATAPTNTNRLNYEGNFYATNFFGSGTLSGVKEVRIAITTDINLNLANYFTKTISGATTLTVSNIPSTGTVASFILDLTNGGSSTITWWGNIRWAGGTAPNLTASGRDVLGFFTHNNGSDWTGLVLGLDVK